MTIEDLLALVALIGALRVAPAAITEWRAAHSARETRSMECHRRSLTALTPPDDGLVSSDPHRRR